MGNNGTYVSSNNRRKVLGPDAAELATSMARKFQGHGWIVSPFSAVTTSANRISLAYPYRGPDFKGVQDPGSRSRAAGVCSKVLGMSEAEIGEFTSLLEEEGVQIKKNGYADDGEQWRSGPLFLVRKVDPDTGRVQRRLIVKVRMSKTYDTNYKYGVKDTGFKLPLLDIYDRMEELARTRICVYFFFKKIPMQGMDIDYSPVNGFVTGIPVKNLKHIVRVHPSHSSCKDGMAFVQIDEMWHTGPIQAFINPSGALTEKDLVPFDHIGNTGEWDEEREMENDDPPERKIPPSRTQDAINAPGMDRD